MSDATVDPLAVLAALGPDAIGTPTPVSGGWDTSIWRFQSSDGAWHALRLLRAEQSATVRRELLAMQAAVGGVPIAEVQASGVWQGRPAMVLRWDDGEPLVRAMQRRPWRIARLGAAFARTQLQIHRIAAPVALRDGAPDSWLRDGEVSEPALIERLRALPVAVDTLVHLDYHPLNVLASDGRITAVIDWTNGAAGDRRADIARTASLTLLAPLSPGPLRPVQEIARRVFVRAWWRTYRAESGPLPHLAPFMAWAGAKFLRDTEQKLGNPGVWATAADLEPMRRWVARWTA